MILNNALIPLVLYSESRTLVPLQILHNAQLTILHCPSIDRLQSRSSLHAWLIKQVNAY